MAQARWAERILSYFATPAELALEELQRQSAMIRRFCYVQLAGAVFLAAARVITGSLIHPSVLISIAAVIVSAILVLLLARERRPVEGAWVLVIIVSGAATLLIVQELNTSPGLFPPLSAVIYLWPLLVAGSMLRGYTVYAVLAMDTLFFVLSGYVFKPGYYGEDFSRQYGIQYIFSIVAALLFVAYVVQRNAASLQESITESEQRAHEILQANEVLLEKNIQQVGLAAQLSTSAMDLSATSRQQASGSAEQASAISEVTSTIEEMGYTARQIAQSAENVAAVADQTLEAVGRGQAAVDETVSAMEGIKGRVQELADKVLALGERSQRIGEIMEIINNIADETHLLALNAAIESAGAGEHGRRFAVVAAEIKNLANRAMDSSKEVRGIIAEIQRATNASVMAAEEGLKETERGVGQVYQAGRAQEEIVVLAQRNSEAAQEISLATTQQRTASEQIVETMREIAEVANQTAEGSRQMAEAATMLSSIADQLQTAGQPAFMVD